MERGHLRRVEVDAVADEYERFLCTAWTADGEIMGMRHKTLDVEGVQFHPESILTEHGHAMLKNFLER